MMLCLLTYHSGKGRIKKGKDMRLTQRSVERIIKNMQNL